MLGRRSERPSVEDEPDGSPPLRRRRSPGSYLPAYLAYQALSLLVWWHLLASGVAHSLPTKSGDPGEEVWFLATLPHSLGSGANPFFSRAIFAPQGVNLLANTSVELLGLVFSPVTVLAGPIAAFSVASSLAPATSALGAFALARRHLHWTPAAWVAGLVYGFGPFLATDLRFGHLDLTWLAFPPLIFLASERLVEPVVSPRSRLARGAVVGVLVVGQFFVSTEFLAITVVMVAVALVGWMIAAPSPALSRLKEAGGGIAAAFVVAGCLLAYPAWFAAAGPRHIVGPVWPHIDRLSSTLAASVLPHGELRGVGFISGGNGSYIGAGLLAVLVFGAIRFRGDRRLRAALALAAVAYIASLGYSLHAGTSDLRVPLPAAVLGHLPLVDSIIPERFCAMVDLFAGLSLAIVCERVHGEGLLPARRGSVGKGLGRIELASALVVCGAALVPLLFEPAWPYPVSQVAPPPAMGGAGPHRLSGIVEVFPTTAEGVADEMTYQAEEGLGYDLGTGYAIVPGQAGHGTQQPPQTAVTLVFAAASLGRLTLPLSATARAAFRDTIVSGGCREVVVLPGATGSATAAAAVTEIFGPPSWRVAGAEVWAAFGRH